MTQLKKVKGLLRLFIAATLLTVNVGAHAENWASIEYYGRIILVPTIDEVEQDSSRNNRNAMIGNSKPFSLLPQGRLRTAGGIKTEG